MALFQKTVVEKYLKSLDSSIIAEKWAVFKAHFHNPEIQENIRNSKEEQYQGGFFMDLFVNVLGYTKNPAPNFNLNTELKNVKDAKKADGGIVVNEKVIGVIELKGMDTTDLGRVETQAFGYKNNQEGCSYVIISNFEKLRFYIDNAIEHLEFNLFQLTEEEFKLLYLCIAFESLSKDIPKNIKKESLSEEDAITHKLYKDYSLFKRELFADLTQKNPEFDPLLLFKKSQKLLDRFLFLFFAEDRHLLPPNSVRLILSDWEDLQERDVDIPLYDRFKKYFEYLNTGFKGKRYDVFAYNGGLFLPDEVLDHVKIDDKLLFEHTLRVSEYDFNSEVDVNILGHIFENSLNEIEEVQAQLEGQELDKSNTKRKKDGVFYTPKYITKYIVENTVGKLCEEKKTELEIEEEAYTTDKRIQKKTRENLYKKLTDYRDWLLQLTIIDPACGSGAFLNEALDFLIKEHQYIDELEAKLTGSSLVLSNIEMSILEHNLFGVDLNEESVEIAKLSLWLRTAQPNRKLNDLNNNLKCGNSLIDDPEIAGDKAFNWEKEFPKVFEKGGFDVVIGNPPYVFARDNFDKNQKLYFSNVYTSAKYQINTYLLFIEKSFNILKSDGHCGLIVPNSWLMTYSGQSLREFLLNNTQIKKIINLLGQSFESANVETIILIGINKPSQFETKVYLNNGFEFDFIHQKSSEDFRKNEGFEFKVFNDSDSELINERIFKDSIILDELVEIKAGLQAYEKGKGSPKQTEIDVKTRPYDYSFKFDKNTHKYLEGKDVGRYFVSWSGQYLKYGENLAAPRTINLFNGEKIIIREITGTHPKSIIATYTEDFFLYNRSNIGIISKEKSTIELKYIVAILNSALLSYYFLKNTAKSVRKLFPKIILKDLRDFPIKNITYEKQQPFINKVDMMLSLNKELQEVGSKFHRTLQRKFPEELEKLQRKLETWYELDYGEFIKELKKKKIKLSLTEEAEWEDYFLAEQKKALEIQSQINSTDKEIDQMVYELYGLTEEEIDVVENS